MVCSTQSICLRSFTQGLFHCKAPVWRCTILFKENVWLEVCHLWAGMKSFMNHPNCVNIYWRPACVLLMQDSTTFLFLFRPLLDVLSSRYLSLVTLTVMSLHLKNQDRHCLLLGEGGGGRGLADLCCQPCMLRQCRNRLDNQLTPKIFSSSFEQRNRFSHILTTL